MEQDGPNQNDLYRDKEADVLTSSPAEIQVSARQKQDIFLSHKPESVKDDLKLNRVVERLLAQGRPLIAGDLLGIAESRNMTPAEVLVLFAESPQFYIASPVGYAEKVRSEIKTQGPLFQSLNNPGGLDNFRQSLIDHISMNPGVNGFQNVFVEFGRAMVQLAESENITASASKTIEGIKSEYKDFQKASEKTLNEHLAQIEVDRQTAATRMKAEQLAIKAEYQDFLDSQRVAAPVTSEDQIKDAQNIAYQEAKRKLYENFSGLKWDDLTPEQQEMTSDDLILFSIESKGAAARQAMAQLEKDYEKKRQERERQFLAEQQENQKERIKIEAELATLKNGQTPDSPEITRFKEQRQDEMAIIEAKKKAIADEIAQIKIQKARLIADLETSYGRPNENDFQTAEPTNLELSAEAKSNLYNQISGGDDFSSLTEREQSLTLEQLMQLAADRRRQKLEDEIKNRTNQLLAQHQAEIDQLEQERAADVEMLGSIFGKIT